MARVVFLGTPAAAVPTLESLATSHDVALAVTQPDRPRGRSKQLVPPPIKLAATDLGIPIAQPSKRSDLHDVLRDASPFDIGVVVAFGQILRPEVLELPAKGFLGDSLGNRDPPDAQDQGAESHH